MTSALSRGSAVALVSATLAGCATFVDPIDTDFVPGTVTLPGDTNEIVPLPSCDSVAFSNVRFSTFGVVTDAEDRLNNGPDGKTGIGKGPDDIAGTEDDEDFTLDDIPYRITLRGFDYAISWDGSNATDILVNAAADYPTQLDEALYAELSGAEANCDEAEPEDGRRLFYCGDVASALVPQPLGARCSASYLRGNATDYFPQSCVESGAGWNVSETRLEGLRAFAKRPLIAGHPYDVTLGAWCEDEGGAARFVSVTERFVTPGYDED